MYPRDDELARLEDLTRYDILDTPPEREFDEITQLAALLFGAPIALVSLVDADRQWFKSRHGLDVQETPRDVAFCAHAVAARQFLEVQDATADPRFADNPLVTQENGIRFYAGAPLITSSGHCLGTLCIIDRVPRGPLTAEQKNALVALAGIAVGRIEARRDKALGRIAARITETTTDAILCLAPDGRIDFWNPAATVLFGHAEAEALGRPLDLIAPAGRRPGAAWRLLRRMLGAPMGAGRGTLALQARRADGTEFPVEVSMGRLPGGTRYVTVIRDASERQILQREQEHMKRFLDTIIENLPAMVFVKDCETGRYLLVNHAAEAMMGCDAAKIIGRTDGELFPGQGLAYMARDAEAVEAGRLHTFESDFVRHDGRTVRVRTKRLVVDGVSPGERYLLGLSEDLTSLREVERRVERLELYDALTGLLNRASYLACLEELAAEGAPFAMLSVDLDRFKAVNDQFGHLVGDKFLAEVGRRLSGCVGAGASVARVGGDEFIILMQAPELEAAARRMAASVIRALSAPYRIGTYAARGGASIGGVLAPRDGITAEELRQNADLALYRAKGEGRGSICFFSAEMDADIKRRRVLERDLERAIEEETVQLVYQPVVSTATGHITSFEALARWEHPQLGPVAPDLFVSIAEECGLIERLGRYILSLACRQAALWRDDLRVAVNLSPLQFEQEDLVDQIEHALRASGLPPHRLQLEVTEGLVLRDVENTFSILTRLRAQGIQILMDDFGVGYSSLSYFTRFPFDKVKIDRSFTRQLDDNPAAGAVIGAVVNLGRALGMGVVAEGVETASQMNTLTGLGCTHLQGFYFGRPSAATTFEGIAARGGADRAQLRSVG